MSRYYYRRIATRLAVVVLGLLLSFWLGREYQRDLMTFPMADNVESVNIGKSYDHVTIPLDGRVYVHCTFKNVRFIYLGAAPLGWYQNFVEGIPMIYMTAAEALDFIDANNLLPPPDDDQGNTMPPPPIDPQQSKPKHALF